MTGWERVWAAGLTLTVLSGLLMIATVIAAGSVPVNQPSSPLYDAIVLWSIGGIGLGVLIMAGSVLVERQRRRRDDH